MDDAQLAELRARADKNVVVARIDLAKALAGRGMIDELRTRGDAGDWWATNEFLKLATEQEVRTRADTGDKQAIKALATRLVGEGRLTDLKARVEGGDVPAVTYLVALAISQDRGPELGDFALTAASEVRRELAKQLLSHGFFTELRARADHGEHWSGRLLYLLQRHLDSEHAAPKVDRTLEAVELERRRAATRKRWEPKDRTAELLSKGRRVDELRALASTGDENAVNWFVRALAAVRNVDELRQVAESGHDEAKRRLIDVLEALERVDELRVHAESGNRSAMYALVRVYRKQERIDELRVLADAGKAQSQFLLAELLAERGQIDELRVRAAGSDTRAADYLAQALFEQGNVDELRALAHTGNSKAKHLLPRLTLDDLRAQIAAGDEDAANFLAEFFYQQKQLDNLRDHADSGNDRAQRLLTSLLVRLGKESELQARANADLPYARSYWAGMLAKQDRVDELRALAETDRSAMRTFVEWLSEHGRFAEIKARTEAGDRIAGQHLAHVLDPPVWDNPEDRLRP
jgi:hypothetical protein